MSTNHLVIGRFSARLPGGVLGAGIGFVACIAGASVLVAVTAVPLGLISHTALSRSVSLGFYALGGLVAVLGLVAGNRGPFRRVDEDAPVRLERQLRRASLDELIETINLSVLMVVIGLVLFAIGVAIDDRYRLF